MYMSSTMKVTLAPQIQNVTESRARVQRDINRNIRLDESEASMTASLESEEDQGCLRYQEVTVTGVSRAP